MNPKRALALTITYNGTAFNGSQLQPEQRTVQGEIERAIEAVCGTKHRLYLASRTDSGVHARGQVGVFHSASSLPPQRVPAALNDHLDNDIKVVKVSVVADSFDPRRTALWREYAYTIHNAPSPPVLEYGFRLHIRDLLNEALMNEAVRTTLGSHDFGAFCGGSVTDDESAVRNMLEADVKRYGLAVTVRLRANAFLNQQVRRMADALIRVGNGSLTLREFRELVDLKVRGAWHSVAPPCGLVLEKIGYPPDCGL